jgi:hypothetical protein
MVVPERTVYRLPGMGQHIPDQEKQDADGDRVKCRPQPRQITADPADRKAKKDGRAGNGAEQSNTCTRHATSNAS